MILITFGLTGISIKKRHEFGHEALPKITQIDFIFGTAFIFGNKGRFFDFMRKYFQNWGAECFPQYRQQVKAIKSKARAQERKYSGNRIKQLEKELAEMTSKYHKLSSDTVEIRNLAYQVRNLKNVDFDKLDKL